jgi:hypothetical protein
MSDNLAAQPSPDRLEFRFRWDKREHRRFYRTLQREARRGSKVRWVLNVWFGFIALVGIRALWPDSDGADLGAGLVPLAIVGGWLVLDQWGLSYLSAQSYEREHAACIPNDQIRVLDADAITAKCTISTSSVHWAGISKVRETEEFFLFFTTPGCAIQLPKRAIEDLERLRAWLRCVSKRAA